MQKTDSFALNLFISLPFLVQVRKNSKLRKKGKKNAEHFITIKKKYRK